MKKFLWLFVLFLVLSGCEAETESQAKKGSNKDLIAEEQRTYENYVDIKYRDNSVDIANSRFEELNTSKSSLVNGAWYDAENDYMVINLKGTYYHYCRMPGRSWTNFKSADSFGTHYNKYIKGSYDCRNNYIPNY